MEITPIITNPKLLSNLFSNQIISKAIINCTSNIYNIIVDLNINKDKHLKQLIEKLDVQAKTKCIESIILNLDGKLQSNTLNIILEQLHEIICKIREDLIQINKIFKNHNQKYFYYIRYIDTSLQTNNLTNHMSILEKRLDLFMKILTIEKSKEIVEIKNNDVFKPTSVTLNKPKPILNPISISKSKPILKPITKYTKNINDCSLINEDISTFKPLSVSHCGKYNASSSYSTSNIPIYKSSHLDKILEDSIYAKSNLYL